MKNSIIKRLLEGNLISIQGADNIINNGNRKVIIIDELHENGHINYDEVITLLMNDETFEIPFGIPNSTQFPPTIQPYTDWTWDPHRPGQPRWVVTCSNDLKDK